ncbi:hypothetical protein M406DRAFT_85163 [Cryphonectria parasitica EP155]|uniref:RecF/RecN/SMC N-terminal domain-containing protein n=1 Tax=Cryphonectria parasitica (strain ATCC 38755 / EP155) TaxID=660469 RepID=A0A9P4XZR4_CRYP1|nr:uncharacterized protein M406DRAFT_85163 [Cryphonectria parasitica EP155]KAF3763752.1 hypothetical protein M406DRAFT_85163 [Cryphonectria parasitica EP155]
MHADDDDRRATQRLQQKDLETQERRQGLFNNRASENGILLGIHCVNFMCHSSLNVELGPLLNFIVGENGSGKSAILTAITLCLGGKASATNRGGSLKAFIKEGQHEARLIVKIKNEGQGAYQHDIYGDFIQVERRFNKRGTSGFRVLSAGGRVISKRKQDVDDIVEYYCLQVDNPLNVLSQDNARQFLNQSTPKQKFKFFMQGVQLQQLDDDYRVVIGYMSSNETKEADLQTRLDICKRDHERAKKDYSLYMESENLRRQHRLLCRKLAWCQVEEVEREVAENEGKLVECDGNIADAQRAVDQKTQQLAQVERQITQAEEDFTTTDEANNALQAKVEQAQGEHEEAKQALVKLNSDERDAFGRVSNARKNVKEYERMIQEEEQRLQDLNGDAVMRRNEELKAAQTRQAQLRKDSEDSQLRIPDLNREIEKVSGELQTLDQLMTEKKNEAVALQKRIRELEQGQNSLYDAYEPQMTQLLRMIDADAGFEQKPVGPVGAHIQVLKPIWSPMLERMFGEVLNGFVVTSKRDQQRLRDMMSRLRITKSPILIGNSRPIDTSRHEPDEKFDTVMRILKIDNSLIRNQLIINNRIEKVILVEDQGDATRIMVHSTPPPNVAACFHLFPGRRDWTVRISVNANGITSAPSRPPDANQKPRLRSDSLQETSLHKETLRQLQGEVGDLQQKRAMQQRAFERCQKSIVDIKKTVDSNKQKAREVQVEIDDIQAELDSFEGVDGRLEGLRADLSKAQEDFDHYGSSYGTTQLRKQEQNRTCEGLRDKVKAAKAAVREFEPQLKKAEDKVKRYKDVRQLTVQEKNEAHDQHAVAIDEKQRHEHKREELQKTVAEFTAQAEQICPRIHIAEDETYDILEKQMDSLRATLQEREKRRGMTDEEVRRRLDSSFKALEEVQTGYAQVRFENQALKTTLEDRLSKWRKFRRYISSQSRANFMYLLSERDFRGRLILRHDLQTLEVQVEPDKTRKNAAARSTKTLSGGEKSFSSICLLLAIWEAMGSPLRCLDEFDVFMDNVNRAISTNMLISAARNSVGRQFILITPNAIEGRANLDQDVKITRMRDPRQPTVDTYMRST